jgi:UDP-N-acetylglucosamine 2-epimerase (non-hydrolysing)
LIREYKNSTQSESKKMNVLTVVGARPNFMKAAPIIAAINKHNLEIAADSTSRHTPSRETIHHVLVHTGQHYDFLMSDSFFSDLNLPRPKVHLRVGSGSHAAQTAEIMRKFEEVLLTEIPDVVIVVGDVNSTMACALVTSKISFDLVGTRPLIAHVEAGLRSHDRSMPEEINRIVTDHVADLLFVTEERGVENLRGEGIPYNRIHFVGNTMIDSLLSLREKAEGSTVLENFGLRANLEGSGNGNAIRPYALLTLHRPSNVDNQHALQNILSGLEDSVLDCPVVFPVHPRTRKRIEEFGVKLHTGGNKAKIDGEGSTSVSGCCEIVLTDPLGYLDFLCLMKHAAIVVTDSGGIQEETTCMGIPCVTVRENTERPVTVEKGTNVVAGTSQEGIKDAIQRQMTRTIVTDVPEKWDGKASARIVDVLLRARERKDLETTSGCYGTM